MHVESLMIQGQSIIYKHFGQRNGARKSCWKEMMRRQVLCKRQVKSVDLNQILV